MANSEKKMSRGGQADQFPPEVGGNKAIPDIGENVPPGGAAAEHSGDLPAQAVKGDRAPGAAGSGGPHGTEKESLGKAPSNAALGNAPRGKSI